MNRSAIRTSIVTLTLLLIVAGCGNGGEATTIPFEPERLVGTWVDMWNSYDLNEVEQLFLSSEQLTYFSSENEGIIRGIDAVREHHRGFGFVEGGKEQTSWLWVEDLESDRFGTSAVVTGIWYFQRAGGEQEEVQRGPVTFVYILSDGIFRLAHLHFANYQNK